jgi:hypothetical protein
MKKIIVTIIVILWNFNISAQTDKSKLYQAIVIDDICWLSKTYVNCFCSSDTLIKKGTYITISSFVCNDNIVEVIINNKIYYSSYMHFKYYLLNFHDIKKFSIENLNSYKEFALKNSYITDSLNYYTQILDSLEKKKAKLLLLKKYDKGIKEGIIITNLQLFDESEYTSGTGCKIDFINLSKKTIKYITFVFQGYNAVNDIVFDPLTGKNSVSIKGIGPIDNNESAGYEKNYAWHTDIVQDIKIKSIVIQYMDGSTKQVLNPHSLILNGNEYEQLLEN